MQENGAREILIKMIEEALRNAEQPLKERIVYRTPKWVRFILMTLSVSLITLTFVLASKRHLIGLLCQAVTDSPYCP